MNTHEHRITPGFNTSRRPLAPLRAPTRRFMRGGTTGLTKQPLRAYPTQSDLKILLRACPRIQRIQRFASLCPSFPLLPSVKHFGCGSAGVVPGLHRHPTPPSTLQRFTFHHVDEHRLTPSQLLLLLLLLLLLFPVLSRRQFLASSGAVLGATALLKSAEPPSEPVIDIHQHTNYSGRTNEQLIAHQKALGVTTTILLPAGSLYGLDAECGGNQTVLDLSTERPDEFLFFANEVPDLPQARHEIERYLKQGAIGIGEQKFRVASDSAPFQLIAQIAREYGVPILMHIQHDRYNTGIQNLHKTLEKFPGVNFIGHAQTWWANVDKNPKQEELYPTTKVTPGGVTDRLLSDYPNMYGDLSAGSGLNFWKRDEDHAKAFITRHQDKLMYGTDCNDTIGRGLGCDGAQIQAFVRRLSPNKKVERKLLYENAKKLLKL